MTFQIIIIVLSLGLLGSVGIFLVPSFQALLTSNPNLAAGFVAFLSATTAGLIGAIANLVQTISVQKVAEVERETVRDQKRTERMHEVMDEKYKVIIQGADRLALEFEIIRTGINSLKSKYSRNAPAEVLRESRVLDFKQSAEVYILSSEVWSLGDAKITKSFRKCTDSYNQFLGEFKELSEKILKVVSEPNVARPPIEDLLDDEKLDGLSGDFIESGGEFRKRLTDLRILEAGKQGKSG